MNTEALFKQSLNMIRDLQDELFNSSFIDIGPRLELVEQCTHISIEHGIAFHHLIYSNLNLQAMIIFRAQFEAIVKSYWILFIATSQQIAKLQFNRTLEEQFESDKNPMISEMLTTLEKADLPARGQIEQLLQVKKYHLKHLNSFVHTGKHAFLRDEMGFDENLKLTLMRQCNNLITLGSQVLLFHAIPNKQSYISLLTNKYRQCFMLIEDEDPEVKQRIDDYLSKSS